MQLPADIVDELTKRLRRIEGQVRGIQAMLADGRDCKTVVAQISAVSSAIDQVGFKLLVTGLATCLADPDTAADAGFELDEVERLFLKLA